jgi:PAS domain S-box-containing protein
VAGPRTPAAAATALAALVMAAASVGWIIGHSRLLLQSGSDPDVQPGAAVGLTIGSALTLLVLLVAVIVLGRWAAARSQLLADAARERRAAQYALVANEQQYRQLFESNPLPMWVYDAETLGFLAVNDAALARYGYARDEFLTMTIKDLRPADELVPVPAHVNGITSKYRTGAVARHRWKDGSVREVEVSSHQIQYGGRPAHLVLAVDVTEKRQAEAEIRRTAALLRAVSDETTEAVFVKDRAGRYLLFNPAASRFVGKPVAEVLGKDDAALFDAESARIVMERDQRIMRSGRAQTVEETLTAAGATRIFLATKAPYRDAEGQVVGLVGISRDITDRSRMEEALRASEARYKALVESAADGIHVNRGGKIVFVNSALVRMLGAKSPDELLGRSPLDLVHPAFHEIVRERVRVVQKTRAPAPFVEEKYVRADGSTVDVEIAVAPFEDGGELAMLVTSRDLTERRRAEAERRQIEDQLRQAQKMEAVGRLAGGVAHDFNNLLTVINGYSDLLLNSGATDKLRPPLTAIRDAGERAAGLTQQLLAFSRKAIIEPKVLDFNGLLERSARLLARVIGEDIALTTDLEPSLGRVKADPGQIEQVVMNLAVNARDAMPKGGRLTIQTRNVELESGAAGDYADLDPGPYVRLVMSDTGCGMTDEVKKRAFEPFFTTKGVGKGTGLGLATVYGIVKTYGGHVGLKSAPGKGTTFEILLPAAPGSATRSGFKPGAAPRGTETVLLIEDEPGVRSVARAALQGQGYQVLEAGSGEEALRVADGHGGQLDLVVTDVVMPGLDGREVVDALRSRRDQLKVLYVSGYTDDSVVRNGIGEAADAFLQKPFTPQILARKVRAILDGPA